LRLHEFGAPRLDDFEVAGRDGTALVPIPFP
jgi:hypothetical protein